MRIGGGEEFILCVSLTWECSFFPWQFDLTAQKPDGWILPGPGRYWTLTDETWNVCSDWQLVLTKSDQNWDENKHLLQIAFKRGFSENVCEAAEEERCGFN